MASFVIEGKVAVITGGASGLGYQCALKLLEKNAKGVTLADINTELGFKAIKEIETRFGKNRAVFVKTDATSLKDFDNAFKETINSFKNVDILINNAAIMNDKLWKEQININLIATIYGIQLALDQYLPKYKSGSEGLIVNLSSVIGIDTMQSYPIYSATKSAVLAITRGYGSPEHYEKTQVKLVAICPGATNTALLEKLDEKTPYGDMFMKEIVEFPTQTPEECSSNIIAVIENASNGTIWVVEAGQPPYQYLPRDRFEKTT